jgi:hypothetical protein
LSFDGDAVFVYLVAFLVNCRIFVHLVVVVAGFIIEIDGVGGGRDQWCWWWWKEEE